jgi:hypothetical protein
MFAVSQFDMLRSLQVDFNLFLKSLTNPDGSRVWSVAQVNAIPIGEYRLPMNTDGRRRCDHDRHGLVLGFRIGLLPDPMARSHGASGDRLHPFDHLSSLGCPPWSQVFRL